MVAVQQQQQAHERTSMLLRARGGIERAKRKARPRAFNLEFSFKPPGAHAGGGKNSMQQGSREQPVLIQTAAPSPAGNQQPASQKQTTPRVPCPRTNHTSNSILLSIASVCIPACEGGRRHARSRPGRKAGSGRNTQLRSFTLHALIPAAAPSAPPSPLPAAPEQVDLEPQPPAAPSQPGTPSGSAIPCITPSTHPVAAAATSSALPTPHPPSSPLQFTGATPRPSGSMLWLRSTPMEGVPERMSLATAMRGRAQLAPPTTCTKPGHTTTYHWLTPIEGLLERRLMASCMPGRTPAPSLSAQPSPAPTVLGTPMEGVPERAALPYSIAAAARMLALRSGCAMDPAPSTSTGTLPAGSPAAAQQDEAQHSTGSLGMQQLSSPAALAAADSPAPTAAEAVPEAVTGAPDLVTGAAPPSHRSLREAQVQTTGGLAMRWRLGSAARVPMSFNTGGRLLPLSSGAGEEEEAGDGGADDPLGGGLYSINSTPEAMKPLGLVTAPPSAQPSPTASQAARGGTSDAAMQQQQEGQVVLQFHDGPAAGEGGAGAGPAQEEARAWLWPASAARSRAGPGAYGDDDAGELVQGGHMAPPGLAPPEPLDQDMAQDAPLGAAEEDDGDDDNGGDDAGGWSEGEAASGSADEGPAQPEGEEEEDQEDGDEHVSGSMSQDGEEESEDMPQQHLEPQRGSLDQGQQRDQHRRQTEEEEEEEEEEEQPPVRVVKRGRITQPKAAAPPTSGGGRVNRRKSLSGAGMVMDEDGCRRSSRPRYRPLQYWRNEHKVFGRDHKTMPTVVAIETRTPNPEWPAESTGHAAKKKMRARTKAALHNHEGQHAPHHAGGAGLDDWDDDA